MYGDWEQKFHECLAADLGNPQYFQCHHLLVLTYMLQTGAYRSPYQPQVLNLLESFLGGVKPDQNVITSLNRHFSSTLRRNNISRSHPLPPQVDWEITIMDIRIDNHIVYRKDVRAWAQSVYQALKNPGRVHGPDE